jgi:ParB family chromosome partitioning protein
VLKDVRVFFNSLQHSIALMRRGGVTVDMEQQETDETFVVTIRIQR